MNENFQKAIGMIAEQFREGGIVCLVLFSIVTILTFVYLIQGLYILKTRAVESFNFILFCIPVLVWAVLTLLLQRLDFDPDQEVWLGIVLVAARLLIAPLLMLHIQSQVTYQPVNFKVRLVWLLVPIILLALWVIHIIYPSIYLDFLFAQRIVVYSAISSVYFVVVIARSYLLCFNVFYQMPPHMRRSTYHLLASITVLAIASVLNTYLHLSPNTGNILLSFALITALQALFTAFFIANSSNVIVTSRDFVFSNLSTIVLIVSRKGNILDWNKKAKDGCAPLPRPIYKEPYPQYRKRIIDTYNGIVSKYDENIISIKKEEAESHLLFAWHDISFLDRKFGYLVEVSDVTKSYQTIRYFEEIALTDNLTGLHNRNAYIKEVKSVGIPENMPLCIIVGDVNDLKKTNDAIGHLHGDRLLRMIADAIIEAAQGSFFIARIGGDEIAILARNAEADVAKTFTEAVDSILSEIHDAHVGSPSISWGWAVMYDESEDYNSLFQEADTVMYESKKKMKKISLSGIVPEQ